jgi:WD40 repeat protein
MAKVFISYHHDDRALALDLRRYLVEHSVPPVDVFLDDDIPPGAEWSEVLEQRLAAASFVVVLLPATDRTAVRAELQRARELQQQDRLRIIPIRLKDRHLPLGMRIDVGTIEYLELAPEQPHVTFEHVLQEVIAAAALEDALRSAGSDYHKASAVFRQLELLPSWRARARSLMASYWDREALALALKADRDKSVLAWLQAATLEPSEQRRTQAADLLGADGSVLEATFRRPHESRNLIGRLAKSLFTGDLATLLTRYLPLVPSGDIAVSDDGLWVAACWDDGDDAFVWRRSGELVARLTHEGPVLAVAISPDGGTVATGSGDGTAGLWRSVDGATLIRPLRHRHAVLDVTFSPDGVLIATASGSVVQLWRVATGEASGPPIQHPQRVLSVAFDSDGRTLATQSLDGMRRWRVGDEAPITADDDFKGAAVVFDGELDHVVARALRSNATWRSLAGDPGEQAVFAHQGYVTALAIGNDGQHVVTGGSDHAAQLWSKNGTPRGPALRHGGAVTAVALSADATTVWTQSKDSTVRRWRVDHLDARADAMRHPPRVTSTWLAPDARTVVSSADDGSVRVWNVEESSGIGPAIAVDAPVDAISAADDHSAILTLRRSKGPLLWIVEGGSTRSHPCANQATRAALSPDGQIIVAAEARSARLCRATNGEPFGAVIEHRDEITALQFSRDGMLVLTGSSDHSGRAWSAATGEPAGAPLAHGAAVRAIDATADREFAATAASGEVRLWRLATGTGLGEPIRHQEKVMAVRFSIDGTWLITATSQWIFWFSFDGSCAEPRAARFLPGWLLGPDSIRSDRTEPSWVHAVLARGAAISVRVMKPFEPDTAPLDGDATALLGEWQTRLAWAPRLP